MIDATAIVLTKNEEKNITDCISSMQGCIKRIVIVDSGSADDTIKISESLGAEIFAHTFENYSRQFNWALDNIGVSTKWTLRIDADERLTPALCAEIEQITVIHENDNINGVTMEANLFFMGKYIKHGGHQKRKLMLFKTGLARIEDRKMDEHTILLSGESIEAKERFIHYDFKNLTHWINKFNWYATREMQDYFEYVNGRKNNNIYNDAIIAKTRSKKFGLYYKLPLFVRPWLLFLYVYIIRLGFLDGKEGFLYHYMYQSWYRTLVDAKIYEQEKSKLPFEETGDLK